MTFARHFTYFLIISVDCIKAVARFNKFKIALIYIQKNRNILLNLCPCKKRIQVCFPKSNTSNLYIKQSRKEITHALKINRMPNQNKHRVEQRSGVNKRMEREREWSKRMKVSREKKLGEKVSMSLSWISMSLTVS